MTHAKRISAILFFAVILAIPLVILFSPKQTFSENENRVLAEFPEVSLESIWSGEFMKGFEAYFADHFLLRDDWIAVKTKEELALGKKEVNGVFILPDRLIEKVSPDYDRALVNKNASAICAFAETTGLPCTVMLVPTACEIQKELLDDNAPILNQKMLIESVYNRLGDRVSTVDVYTPLYHSKDEYIYYRTDHHWTTLGAYFGYSAASTSLGYQTVPLDDFDIQHASHNFYGTTFSKVIDRDIPPDTVDYYFYPGGTAVTEVTVDNGKTETVHDSLYFREYLGTKDQYSSFLGSNQPLVTVKTDCPGGEKLLVIKDSYAHCMIPFLAQHYSEIAMADLRYLAVGLDQKLDLESFDQVLFVYNAENFAADRNLAKLGLVKGDAGE